MATEELTSIPRRALLATEEEEAARGYDSAAAAYFSGFAATNVMLGLLPGRG